MESKHDLGVLCLHTARYQDAEPLLVETFQGRKLKLGPAHPYTLETCESLIQLYEAWGKPNEAKAWQDRHSRSVHLAL